MEPRVQSVLAADFGSVNTRVVLFGLVNGQYRLVSRHQTSTTLREAGDVTIGMSRAVEVLQNQTGHYMLDEQGSLIFPEEEDGSGIDEIVITTSATRPLKAALVGLIRDVSMDSAVRALSGTYIDIVATVAVSDDLSEEEQINRILRASPDLIFVVGGTNNGNIDTMREVIRMVKLALELFPEGAQPIVLYAGNQDLASEAYYELRIPGVNNDVFAAPNIRPSIDTEQLKTARLELSLVYNQFVASQPGGFREMAIYFSKAGVIPTAQGIANIMRWLGQTGDSILHIDIGSANSALTVALDQDVSANVQSDLGVGHSIVESLHQIDLAKVLDWIPFQFADHQLHTYAYDKSLLPASIPQNNSDLMIEYAILRGIIQYLIRSERSTWASHLKRNQNLPAFDYIIAAGATLTQASHPAITAMLLIDALGLEGVHDLYMDVFGILPALGATALVDPAITVQVFENHALTYLAPVFCASGRPRRRGNKPGMKIRIRLANGRTVARDLEPGEIWSAPLSPGQEAEIEVQLSRGLNINGRSRIKQKVSAGLAGIIFDARGRPFNTGSLDERPALFNQWWTGLTDQPLTGWERWQDIESTEAGPAKADVDILVEDIELVYARQEDEA